MDAFYASVEVLRYPQLKEYVVRGVITTATYAARQFGDHGADRGGQVMSAGDFEEIRHHSRQFKAVAQHIVLLIEDRGVD